MHYIRFLKQPRLTPDSTNSVSPSKLSAKIVITTDLGESFLLASIPLLAHVELDQGVNEWVCVSEKEVQWTSRDGYTGLQIALPLPRTRRGSQGKVRMVIRAKDDGMTCQSLDRTPSEHDEGGVVSVWSMAFDLANQKTDPGTALAERVFSVGTDTEIHIWEENGESIARHIWDAGLLLSSYLSSLRPANSFSKTPPELSLLSRVLQNPDLKVLELGAGCGIVGITLSTLFPNISSTLLTDLPEALPILTHNLTLPSSPSSRQISPQVLNWSLPLPANISSTSWDLIVVADCTYNPDVVPDLVTTLRTLMSGSEDTLVLLAMKVRHDSELIFFDLMRQQGFVIREKLSIASPVLGGEKEEIEIFGFGFKGCR